MIHFTFALPSNQAAGTHLATMVQIITNLGTSITIAFIYSWELTLLILLWVPILLIFSGAELKMLTRHAAEDKRELEAAGRVLTSMLQQVLLTAVTDFVTSDTLTLASHQYFSHNPDEEDVLFVVHLHRLPQRPSTIYGQSHLSVQNPSLSLSMRKTSECRTSRTVMVAHLYVKLISVHVCAQLNDCVLFLPLSAEIPRKRLSSMALPTA